MRRLTRFPDWSDRLRTYLDRVRDEPFQWGEHDCILFTFGAVKAITGRDFIRKVRGTYSTKLEAARVLRDLGHGTLVKAVTKKLGKPVHVAQAGRGDLVRKDKAVGVVVSHGWAWFVGEESVARRDGTTSTRHGLVCVGTLQCDEAWKVAPVREPR